ncbi:hypothetical protein AAFM46_12055 [Arthrobacter sp. TMP15]
MIQRQAVVKKRALTYKKSPRAVKTRILDELVELPFGTGTMHGRHCYTH